MLKYFGKVHKKNKFLAILEGVFFTFFRLVGANHGGASSDSIECWSTFSNLTPGFWSAVGNETNSSNKAFKFFLAFFDMF